MLQAFRGKENRPTHKQLEGALGKEVTIGLSSFAVQGCLVKLVGIPQAHFGVLCENTVVACPYEDIVLVLVVR